MRLLFKSELLNATGRCGEAVVCCNHCCAFIQTMPERGFALCSMGKEEEGVVCFDAAMKADSGVCKDVFFTRAWFLENAGRLDEADECYKVAGYERRKGPE